MESRVIVETDLLATLEDQGHRVTVPRRRLLSLLSSKQEGFSVEELCSEVPDVGRATVYRTVKLLLDSGAICKLTLPDGTPKYSLGRAQHHHHTVCVRCGSVGEFRHATVERLLRAMGDEVPGEIVGHRMELYVTCPECLSQAGSS
jgi:Fur family ferric uptake transcriptional regulator